MALDLVTSQHGGIGDCEIICLHAGGELEPEFARLGIPVTKLPSSGRGVLQTAWHLARLLRARQPRIVHAHSVSTQIAVALGRRLRPWGNNDTRVFFTAHGRLPDDRRSILALRRWLREDFDAIVGVSEDVCDQLIACGIGSADRTRLIRNGVDLARFSGLPGRARNGVHRIVSVGRLAPIKGQDVLLEALVLARPERGQVTITLVGDGPTRGELGEQSRRLGLAGMIQFAGAQPDVRPFLDSADLFVLPSRSEGTSLALLEAMACALPVVATSVGGTPEVTGPGRGGILVPPDDPAALAKAIAVMLNDRQLASSEAAAGRRRVEEAYSLEHTVAAYEELYGLAPTRD